MKNIFLNCLIFIGLIINYAYSQELVPPIQSYSPADYGAASQNWDIALDDRGVVYAANNQGLLVFDGLSWELYSLENQSIIRSVYPYQDRIYTGSYQEFGFWETLNDGRLHYTSLTPLMQDLEMQSDEFWEIISYNNAIYFRSFGAIYKYESDKITKIKNEVSTALGNYRDRLIYAPRLKGLAYLNEDGESEALEGDLRELNGINIIDIKARGNELFIAGKEELFIYKDQQLSRIKNRNLNSLLVRSELNHIISISENELVLGTIKDGIVQYNLKEDHFKVYGRSSGLQNNTVLGMAYSRGKLWLALDKGVDMIDLKAPFKFYTENTGELGAIYDMQNFNGTYYFASNTGVYTFMDGQLKLIEDAGDHAWNLEVIDNTLYANHNTGTYKIENNKFIPVDTRTGSFSIKKIGTQPGKLMIADYTGLSIYDKRTGKVKELSGISFPVKDLVIENSSRLWVAHPYEGIYKITHEEFENLQVEKISSLGKTKNFNPRIYNINNQILSFINGKWFKYNPFKDQFEIFKEFEAYSNSGLILNEEPNYVFCDIETGALTLTNLQEDKVVIGPELLNSRLVKANENIIQENDSVFNITLNDGFVQVNLRELKRQLKNPWVSEPFIKEFSAGDRRFMLNESPVIPYAISQNITLKAGLPESSAHGLQYKLTGEDNLNGKIASGVINFRNLEQGDYELQLSTIGGGLINASSKTFKFSIAPPWYLSMPMKMVYALMVISIGFLIIWLNKMKLRKHQLQLEARFEKEHMERLNKLEKEKLMNEIDLKRKELANTTMMAAKKNEVLMEIQAELNKDKTKFSNQFRLKHIMNKINNAVKNKDEWKLFETNFNEVHEDFFKDILKEYPKLTSKDLKLCSYLKMNLSSKEIAPLMGISVRGVEVHRYRLRKKMDLDSDVNLTKFLIKNF
ncbi:LuxR C-terminal-related transcriptional regulator [Christiangramia aquimixticola]|uniref:helix-turn-helix and ligand-binding sensor domain-containing protein n=1 Tax=Christiangramia aquimixticola TaxID=1697558 RepID=UPI003AA93352